MGETDLQIYYDGLEVQMFSDSGTNIDGLLSSPVCRLTVHADSAEAKKIIELISDKPLGGRFEEGQVRMALIQESPVRKWYIDAYRGVYSQNLNKSWRMDKSSFRHLRLLMDLLAEKNHCKTLYPYELSQPAIARAFQIAEERNIFEGRPLVYEMLHESGRWTIYLGMSIVQGNDQSRQQTGYKIVIDDVTLDVIETTHVHRDKASDSEVEGIRDQGE